MNIQEGIAKKRFDKLDSQRDTMLERMRKCAQLTIPHLLPPKNHKEDDQLPTPYQGLGARAVNNLSAKLLLTLLPANEPFYRLDIDPEVLQELKETMGDNKFKTQIDEKLATHERMGVKLIERNAYRVQLYKTLRLLICTGNAMLETPTKMGKPVEGKLKVHRVDHYVIRRSPSGLPLEICLREMITIEELPDEIRTLVSQTDNAEDTSKIDEDNIGLYTYCRFDGKMWNVFQEALGYKLPDTEGQFKPENFPFIPLAWQLTEGEHYGRGHVEEFLGDFMSLDGLSEHLLAGAAIMAKVIFMVNTNGVTSVDDLMEVLNGGFVSGNREDVDVLQADKYADFKVAMDESSRIERRLANAFLLTDSIRRDAERVTATELRIMAQDLEDALGGVYSVLSQELQLPLAQRVIKQLPPLPKEVSPSVVTGFDALGRGHDLMKLEQLIATLAPLGPEVINTWVESDELIARVCVSLGIDKAGLIRTIEQVAEAQKQNESSALMEKVAPQLAGVAAQNAMPQGGTNG